MLNNQYYFTLDTIRKTNTPSMEFVRGDTNTNILYITVTQNYAVLDLTNLTPVLSIKKADETEVLQEVTIVNAIQGQIKCVLNTQSTAAIGTNLAEITLFENKARLTSTTFKFKVRESLTSENAVKSENEYSILTNLIQEVKMLTLNVKQFGAKGDGKTDDTIAIQKCFDSIKSNERATVIFPDGVYLIDGIHVQNKDEICIKGNSWNTVLQLKSNSKNQYILFLDNCPRFIMQDIKINGDYTKQTIENCGLLLKESEFSIVDRCCIMFCKGNGISIIGYWKTVMQDGKPVMENGKEKKEFMGADEIHITNCFIQLNQCRGIYVNSVMDLTITHNNIEFNQKDGIYMHHDTGIACGNSLISNNHIISNEECGIFCEADCSRITVNSNHIRNNGQWGVRWLGGRHFFLSNNNIHVNGRKMTAGYSGAIIGYTVKVYIIGNAITSQDNPVLTQGRAIDLYGAKQVYVIGNDLEPNALQGDQVFIDPGSECISIGNNGTKDRLQFIGDNEDAALDAALKGKNIIEMIKVLSQQIKEIKK